MWTTNLLTNTFHGAHYGGCAVLLNKDTFFADVKVKSTYLHDTRRELPDEVMGGDSGWVFTGRASTCLFSLTISQRPKNIHSSVVAHHYHSRQETWHWKEAYPYDSCSDA